MKLSDVTGGAAPDTPDAPKKLKLSDVAKPETPVAAPTKLSQVQAPPADGGFAPKTKQFLTDLDTRMSAETDKDAAGYIKKYGPTAGRIMGTAEKVATLPGQIATGTGRGVIDLLTGVKTGQMTPEAVMAMMGIGGGMRSPGRAAEAPKNPAVPEVPRQAGALAPTGPTPQERTAQLLGAAKETVTPPELTPKTLGPKLTGDVNLKRFRSGKGDIATDKFTTDDLRSAGVPQEQIDKIVSGRRPNLQGAQAAPPEAATPKTALDRPDDMVTLRAGGDPEDKARMLALTEGRVHPEGPLSRAPAVDNPRELENQLFQLHGLNSADKIEALKRTEALPKDVPPETWEKLYHAEENPNEKVTRQEKALYDEHVAPIRDEADKLQKELSELTGVKIEINENHTPRYVKGRTRSFGEMLEQFRAGVDAKLGGAPGRSMRKSTESSNRREFFNAVNSETGEKQLVYVPAGGKAFPVAEGGDLGELGTIKGAIGPRSKFKNASGEQFSLEDATTKEIEDAARVRYTKNLFANRMDNLLKLRAATRNAKFLEQAKASPEWSSVAVKAGETPVAPKDAAGRTWRIPKLPQFRDWYVEPRIADALDDFRREMDDPDSLNHALSKIGHVMNAVMFINPKAHIDNVFNHLITEGGLVGNIKGAPSLLRNIGKATKEVLTAGPEYIRTLKAGAALPYSRFLSGDLHNALIQKLGGEVEREPGTWNRMAQVAGYPDAKTMLKRWALVPQKVLWASSDIMTLAKTMQLRERGIPLEKAFQETERHMPNYRVPGQVMGKRFLAELFQNPAVGRFGRYQYGRLASYFRLLKEGFGPGQETGERLKAFDKMAMLGFYLSVMYPTMDKAWQLATGNSNAKTTRAGAASVPQAVIDVVNGDKQIGDLPESVFTPGVPLEMPMELYHGRYLWSGQPIIRQGDIDAGNFGRAGKDALEYGASKLSTLGQLGDAVGGKGDPKQILLQAMGVKSPTDEQVAGKKAFRQRDKKAAIRRDLRLEAQ